MRAPPLKLEVNTCYKGEYKKYCWLTRNALGSPTGILETENPADVLVNGAESFKHQTSSGTKGLEDSWRITGFQSTEAAEAGFPSQTKEGSDWVDVFNQQGVRSIQHAHPCFAPGLCIWETTERCFPL